MRRLRVLQACAVFAVSASLLAGCGRNEPAAPPPAPLPATTPAQQMKAVRVNALRDLALKRGRRIKQSMQAR